MYFKTKSCCFLTIFGVLATTSAISREFFEMYYLSNKGMNLCLLSGGCAWNIVQGTVFLSRSLPPAGGYKSCIGITSAG